MLGFWEEVRQLALVELGLSDDTALEESFAGGIEGSVEDGEEGGGFFGEDVAGLVVEGSQDGDALDDVLDVCCHAGCSFGYIGCMSG